MDATSVLILTAVAACAGTGGAALARSRGRASRVSFGLGAIGAAAWLFAVGSVRVSPTAGVAVLRAQVAWAIAALLPLPWTVLLLVHARDNSKRILREWRPYLVAATCASVFFAVRSFDRSVLFGVGNADDGYSIVFGPAGRILLIYLIATVVVLLFNLEITVRAARTETLSRIKYAAVGLAASLMFQAFVLSTALLYSRVQVSLLVAGVVPALVATALIAYSAARHRLTDATVRIGRPVFYTSFTAFTAGAYLLAVGLVGFLIRERGWRISTVPLVSAVFVALLLLSVFLTSSRIRRHIRRFIDANFYLSRYDYRREWARASRAVSVGVDEAEIVESVRALIADSLDTGSVEVALVEGEDCGPRFFGRRALDSGLADALSDDEFIGLLAERRAAVRTGIDGIEPELTDWAERHAAALGSSPCAVAGPLFAGARFVGVVLVGARRGGRHTSEDLDLLTTIGLHAGNALLAARLAARLAEARELETLDRLSSFVVHDLKNCVTGLSLLLKNAQTRMENPEFRKDCLESLADSIDAMERIIARVGGTAGASAAVERGPGESVGLADAVRKAIAEVGLAAAGSPVEVRMAVPEDLAVATSRSDVSLVLRNLLSNSREAMKGAGEINVHAESDGSGNIVVRVWDTGPGIPPHLLDADALFRPFRTTKETGLGLGLYQCRAIVQACGGRIRASNGERGAIFEVTLPAAA
jgi:putative PEP-CTERM system histidine kinase